MRLLRGDMNFAYFTAGLGGSGAVNLLLLGAVSVEILKPRQTKP